MSLARAVDKWFARGRCVIEVISELSFVFEVPAAVS